MCKPSLKSSGLASVAASLWTVRHQGTLHDVQLTHISQDDAVWGGALVARVQQGVDGCLVVASRLQSIRVA